MINGEVNIKNITISDLVFEERVKLACFTCKNYNKKWCCPPNIPDLNYQKILSEYEHLNLVYYQYKFEKEISQKDRIESTSILHNYLLKMEQTLGNNNNPMVVSFIGGCCKLCGYDCESNVCLHHTKRRIPFEALGINIVAVMKKIGVSIVFPPKKYFYRIGLIAW